MASQKQEKSHPNVMALFSLPAVGLEPTRPCGQQILSLSCLPISPRRQGVDGVGL